MRKIRFGEVFFLKNCPVMIFSNISDVFFDLDHTLWDFDRNSALAFHRVFRKHNVQLDVSEFLREYEPINLQYWKQFREEKISKEELRRGRLVETFRIFDMEIPLDFIDFLAESYIQELPADNHLFSGSIEILDYLSPKYKLHIITNGFGEVQHLKLRNSGIEKYFKTITTSEEVGVKKPHPAIFRSALSKASALPRHSIMIGDNMEADIVGARNAGMHTLLFNNKKDKVDNEYLTINELSQIKNCL